MEVQEKKIGRVFRAQLKAGEDFFEEMYKFAERENIKFMYDGEIPWPHSRAWYIQDPTGYEIEVACWNDDTIRFDPL